MEKALSLIKSLERLPEAVNFLKPVDFKSLGLLDYLQIIKTPMDLSTIRKKIKQEKYSTIEEVIEDIVLIWDNCRAYNQSGSVISKQAIVASANSMQSKFKSICEELGVVLNNPEKRERNSVTFDMLVELAEKYRLATPESLVEVIKLMEIYSKSSIEKIGNKFLQIKFDKIDKALYDKLNLVIDEQPKVKKARII